MRQFPRVKFSAPTSLVLSNNEQVNVTIVNISEGGLKIECDYESAHLIKSNYDLTRMPQTCIFLAKFNINIGDKSITIETECKMVYIIKVAENLFTVGLQFFGLSEINKLDIHRFIEYLLEQ